LFSKLVKIFGSLFMLIIAMVHHSGQAKILDTGHSISLIEDSTKKIKVSKPDTLQKKKADNNKLKSKIKYTAKDSIRFDIQEKKVYLYGNAEVTYEDINLKANKIVIDWNDQTVNASEGKDSLGKIIGKPEFKQGGQQFKASSMRYNFQTKKGKINYITTSEGGGYIHGEQIKKDENNNFFIKNGSYTTCNADTPHFCIGAKKLEVIKNDKIITGPAVLIIEGIKTPLILPFGFFPHKNGRSSGILIPAYGESTNLGFNLRNGGYYFGISDNFDLALRGDIYSKGSWAANSTTNYVKRYRYNGNFKLSYSNMINGEEGFPGFNINKNFFVTWSHVQDPKSNPVNRFSASVNAGSSAFYQNYVTYNPANYLTNTYQSNISYSRIFPGKPYNLSVNLRHTQNTRQKTVDLNLPDIAFSVNRFYPFKFKNTIGPARWYEKIGVSYNLQASNQIHTFDSILFTNKSLKNSQNGMRHSIPISTNFNVLKYFNVSPSINYNEYWYLESIKKTHASDSNYVKTEVVPIGFVARDYSFSTSVSTRLYGMLHLHNTVLKALRHIVTPTVSYSWRPDFSESKYGYYGTVPSTIAGKTERYSYLERGIYGGPQGGRSSLVSFTIDNNLELKVRNRNDTVDGTKKIKIFESLSFSSAYNMAADSFKLKPIGIAGRTTLINQFTVNFSGVINPYVTDGLGHNKDLYAFKENKSLGKLVNGNISFGYSFNNKMFKKSGPTPPPLNDREAAIAKARQLDYVDFSIPWDLSFNYNLNYVKIYVQPKDLVKPVEFSQSLSFNGNFSVTPKWKVGGSSGYDFIHKDFTYTNISIYRDLHCWEMRATWIPFGPHQSYTFQINVKSTVLQDLKLLRTRNWNQLN
jgi:lipopolysaccharide assembly outer membrane protein LptD (OstA)